MRFSIRGPACRRISINILPRRAGGEKAGVRGSFRPGSIGPLKNRFRVAALGTRPSDVSSRSRVRAALSSPEFTPEFAVTPMAS